MDVPAQIIGAIRSMTMYEFSVEGYTITIESLDELLPDIARHLIVGAIIEMDGVEVTDSATGAIYFPPVYFR